MNTESLILASLLLGSLFSLLMVVNENSGMKEKVIEVGCAQFNPSTGDFEWLESKKH